MRRREDEKMRYRPPLLEELWAQTLSGKYIPNKTAILTAKTMINHVFFW